VGVDGVDLEICSVTLNQPHNTRKGEGNILFRAEAAAELETEKAL
jgi:hypothetical protein